MTERNKGEFLIKQAVEQIEREAFNRGYRQAFAHFEALGAVDGRSVSKDYLLTLLRNTVERARLILGK